MRHLLTLGEECVVKLCFTATIILFGAHTLQAQMQISGSPSNKVREGENYSERFYIYDYNTDNERVNRAYFYFGSPDFLTATITQGGSQVEVAGIPTSFDIGTYTVRLIFEGNKGTTTSITWDLTVEKNYPPAITSTPPTSVGEGSRYSYTITTDDPNGDPRSLAYMEGPNWLTLSGSTLTGTPGYNDSGSYTIKLRASDGDLSGTQNYTLTVKNTNRPPSITSSPVTAGKENQFYSYNLSGSDPDGNSLRFSAPTKPAFLSLTDAGNGTANLEGTPGYNHAGSYTVKIRVSDGSTTTDQTFTLAISNTNRAPDITSSPITSIAEGQAYSYSINATDPDGDGLAYSKVNGPHWLAVSGNILSGTPTLNDAGSYTVEIRASDGSDFDTQSYTLTVADVKNNRPAEIVSRPPVATNNEVVIASGLEFAYQITVADTGDAINDQVTITATLQNGEPLPGFLSIAEVKSDTSGIFKKRLSGTPGQGDIGEHKLLITARDEGGLITEQQFTLTVTQGNRRPAFTSSPETHLRMGKPYSYTIQASDPDSNSISYRVAMKDGRALPWWLTVIDHGDGTATIEGIPPEEAVGQYPLVITATDNGQPAKERTQEVTLHVEYKLVTELKALYNYPNPFQSRTRIKFELPVEDQVYMELYSLAGGLIRKTEPRTFGPGANEFDVQARSMASGIYIYRIISSTEHATGKLTLIR